MTIPVTSTRPLESGLVLNLKFNENGGEVAHDYSGQRNHGTFKGAGDPTWITDGVDFDGFNDYIEVADDATLDITDLLSILVEIEEPGATEMFLSKWYSTAYEFGVVNNKLKAYITGGTVGKYIVGSKTLDSSRVKVVLTYNQSTQLACLYIDGELDNSDTLSDATLGANGIGIHIGERWNGSPGWLRFSGKIYAVKIWNKELSAEEVKLL